MRYPGQLESRTRGGSPLCEKELLRLENPLPANSGTGQLDLHIPACCEYFLCRLEQHVFNIFIGDQTINERRIQYS